MKPTNLCRIFLVLATSQSLLYSDFLGSSFEGYKDIADTVKSEYNYNKGMAQDAMNEVNGILDDVKGYGLDAALASGTDLVFNDPAFSSWWQNNATWATGTMELCYKFTPSEKKSSSVNGDICGLLKNTGISVNIDPCAALPNKIGNYTKISNPSNIKMDLPFGNWCRAMNDEVEDKTTAAASGMMGLSGKTKDAVKDKKFNSEYKNKISDKVDGFLNSFDTSVTKDGKSVLAEKVKNLKEGDEGYVYHNELKRLAKNNKAFTKEELYNLKEEIVFKNIGEYHADLNAKAESDAALYRQLFNFNKHIETANSQFSSMNKQRKGLKDKKAFVEDYIENEKTGLRKQYRSWAEDRAEEEIMYELPQQLEKYHVFFEAPEGQRLAPGAISKMNDQIIRQELLQNKIMMKWRQLSDEKADALKNRLVKNMFASEVFDENAARAEIYKMMAPKKEK